LSSFLLESSAFVFYQAGLLKVLVTDASLPASSPLRLNTMTFAGDAPGLVQLYPNNSMQLAVGVAARPTLVGDGSTVNLTVALAFDFGVILANGSVAEAFALSCPFVGGISVGITGQRLVGNISFLSCRIAVVSTAVGPIDDVNLNGLAAFVLEGVVLPMANSKLAPGFPLPSLDGVSFHNSAAVLSSVCAGVSGAFCLPAGVCSSDGKTACSSANAGAFISVLTDVAYSPAQEAPGAAAEAASLRGAQPAALSLM
jgi:hypothetical protein